MWNPLRAIVAALLLSGAAWAEDFPKPYSPSCTERENVFEFTEKPSVRSVGPDRYEIAFAAKGNCDVTVAVVDAQGGIVRHLASGVLGANAPAPFRKSSLKQTIYWDGKDDLAAYVKEPQKLAVRVQLGLKPALHRLMGGADPHDLPGVVIGLAVGADGACVFSKGGGMHDHACLRKFDHDGNYLRSLAPPPSDLPWDRLNGCGYVEYEPGKRALHGPKVLESLAGDGFWLVGLNAGDVSDLQPALSGGRLYYLNGGSGYFQGRKPSALHYLFPDGGTDVPGVKGRPFLSPDTSHTNARLAASPDGKWLYMINPGIHAVFRCALQGDGAVEAFPGGPVDRKKRLPNDPGSDDAHFNNPTGIDCDAQGRVYVSDCANNRLQVFSHDLKLLKSIKADRPNIVRVHQKTGAIYLFHYAIVKGRTVPRLTKLSSFDNPREEFFVDGLAHGMMAVDSWTPKPRLWIGGEAREGYSSSYEGIYHLRAANVTVWEEDGGTLKKIVDFDEIARNQVGEGHVGAWSSSVFDHVNCDPTREELYWRGFRANPWVLDLKTGRKLRQVHMPGSINDLAFDKRGYLHIHLDPGFFVPGVVRMNPANEKEFVDHLNRKYPGVVVYREVPYDYGVEVETKTKQRLFVGAIPVKDQPGAKFFQDGFGVNMRGDMAVQSNIYFMPRMDEESYKAAFAGLVARVAQGGSTRRDGDPYQDYLRSVREKQKMGEELYFIPRRPGIPLSGATVWTYDATGQLRQECAVLGGGTMAGVQIDEDGDIYFVTSRQRLFNGRPFLSGHKKHLGSDEPVLENDRNPFTACLVKARSKAAFLLRNAVVPMDAPPGLPADMVSGGPFGDPEMGGGDAWANGVEWIYAGAGPVVASGCTCASMRPHLDWFKRSYVPEAYRHSIGVLDTAGNLILHLGSYGNHDDALKMAPGTADIRMFQPRFLSGTDHYLAFDDWGERLVVLRLGYHAEATAPVK